MAHRHVRLLTTKDEHDVWHEAHASGLESHRQAQTRQLTRAEQAENEGKLDRALELYQDVYDRDTFINDHSDLWRKIRDLRTRLEQK